jgi:hypothetical protein
LCCCSVVWLIFVVVVLFLQFSMALYVSAQHFRFCLLTLKTPNFYRLSPEWYCWLLCLRTKNCKWEQTRNQICASSFKCLTYEVVGS